MTINEIHTTYAALRGAVDSFLAQNSAKVTIGRTSRGAVTCYARVTTTEQPIRVTANYCGGDLDAESRWRFYRIEALVAQFNRGEIDDLPAAIEAAGARVEEETP